MHCVFLVGVIYLRHAESLRHCTRLIFQMTVQETCLLLFFHSLLSRYNIPHFLNRVNDISSLRGVDQMVSAVNHTVRKFFLEKTEIIQ